MKNILLSGILSALVVASGACAQASEEMSEGEVAEHREELREHRKEHHKERRKARMEKKVDRMYEEVDTNQDGELDLNEYLANAEARFNKMDVDGNGRVTKEEGQQAMAEMRKKIKERRKKYRKGRDFNDK